MYKVWNSSSRVLGLEVFSFFFFTIVYAIITGCLYMYLHIANFANTARNSKISKNSKIEKFKKVVRNAAAISVAVGHN